jgi:hypothetical protein
MKRKSALLVTLLSLFGCASLPPFPEVNQCGYSNKFGKFRCVNKKTGKSFNVRLDDPMIEGAQCLPTQDPQRSYSSAQAWIDSVVQIAHERCR